MSIFLFLLPLLLFPACSRSLPSAGAQTISWEEGDQTRVDFSGRSALVRGPGAVFSSGDLTISQEGTYVLTGSLEGGRILINAPRSDRVVLVLNGLSLRSDGGPAIYAQRSRELHLVLEEGTVNSIRDGTQGRNDDHNAAIYSQHDIQISGGGTLRVEGNYHHGIRSQDILTIHGGNIEVRSLGDALRGRDAIIIHQGNFSLHAEGDGLQSNNPNGGEAGQITIYGGVFEIQAGNDGIQAESSLTIYGGDFSILAGGGSANAPPRTRNNRGGGRGGWGWNPAPAVPESESQKGLKAKTLVHILGGTFVIDAADDGIHSDGDVLIGGGTFTISTGDDGINGDGAVVITGGDIHITESYEGIEGMTVTISGGRVRVFARDDGLNATGGSSRNDMAIRITGGHVEVHALADGIDSNGNVFLEGGTLMISGPSQMMNGAIDQDGQFFISGGELITAGSVLSVAPSSTQPAILLSYARQESAGTRISISDSRGNIILEYTALMAFSYSGFTSPAFRIGETYTLHINGTARTEITLGAMLTRLSDNGGTYNQGRGGFNQGGGRMPPGTPPPGGLPPGFGEPQRRAPPSGPGPGWGGTI
ncbi:MAG: carbohydrate-binding domain-containing protein [Treponema sp.]|nr:carbohydrate-binding domain-containing protein [Treponema sp.]